MNKTKNTWASIFLEFLSFVLNKLPGQFFFIAFIAPSMQLSQPNVSIFRATCAQLGLNESRQVSRHTKQPATFLPSNIRAKGQGMQWPWKREIWTSGHQIQQSLSIRNLHPATHPPSGLHHLSWRRTKVTTFPDLGIPPWLRICRKNLLWKLS